MAARKAITKAQLQRWGKATKAEKSAILDAICEVTGWHRDHARKAIRQGLAQAAAGGPPPRKPRDPVAVYGPEVIELLTRCWAALDGPCGKRLAPALPQLLTNMARHGHLDAVPQAVIEQVKAMSPATIDRRLAPARTGLVARTPISHTRPGSMLKSSIPMKTWQEWNETIPGFIQIDLVGHEGGDNNGAFFYSLDATDVATGWTETITVRSKGERIVAAGLGELQLRFPFHIAAIHSDNGSEFINRHLVRWCEEHKLTFTRSRSGNKNDGAHVEEKNWSVVRKAVGYHRYDTPAEQDLLNRLYGLLRLQNNFFSPSQKLIAKHRHGAKVTKRYDTAQTPYQRVLADPNVTKTAKAALTRQYKKLNPAQLRREILDLQDEILATVRAKHQPARLPVDPAPTRALSHEATKRPTRAS